MVDLDEHHTAIRACIGKHFKRVGNGPPTGHKIWHFLSPSDRVRLDVVIADTLKSGHDHNIDLILMGIGVHSLCNVVCRRRTKTAATLILRQHAIIDYIGRYTAIERERESKTRAIK